MAYTTINKSTDYMNTKLYTGNGSTNTAQTGVGFQPDWTWIKERSSTSSHILTDAVRGANKSLSSNLAGNQSTETQSLMSFDSDGFTVGSGGGVNENSQTYVAWNWKANGQGSSNTAGTINTTYTSVNTTSGFSIIQYTGNGSSGATIGHGLGVAPKLVIVKLTSGSGYDWGVYHASLGNTKNLRLNLTDAEATSTAFWNDTTPSSSLVTLGNNATVNGSGSTYIAYCFAGKQGFSKFGSYIGNGNDNGPFVYTGFKPAFLLLKMSSGSQGWFLVDNKRANPFNVIDASLHPNANAAEDTSSDFFVDFTSNGFKLRDSDAQLNGSGSTYIYMAFAESPFVSSSGVPTTAR